MPAQALTTETATAEDRQMLDKAAEIVGLFQTAIELGFSITFTPDQLKLLITICEEGTLVKNAT